MFMIVINLIIVVGVLIVVRRAYVNIRLARLFSEAAKRMDKECEAHMKNLDRRMAKK